MGQIEYASNLANLDFLKLMMHLAFNNCHMTIWVSQDVFQFQLEWNGKFWNSIGLLLRYQMTYNVARYCQIFSDLLKYYPMLCNIVQYCLILFNSVQVAISAFFFWVVIIFLEMLINCPILLNIFWYCQALHNIVWYWPILSSGPPCGNFFCGLIPSCVSIPNFSAQSHVIVPHKLDYF